MTKPIKNKLWILTRNLINWSPAQIEIDCISSERLCAEVQLDDLQQSSNSQISSFSNKNHNSLLFSEVGEKNSKDFTKNDIIISQGPDLNKQNTTIACYIRPQLSSKANILYAQPTFKIIHDEEASACSQRINIVKMLPGNTEALSTAFLNNKAGNELIKLEGNQSSISTKIDHHFQTGPNFNTGSLNRNVCISEEIQRPFKSEKYPMCPKKKVNKFQNRKSYQINDIQVAETINITFQNYKVSKTENLEESEQNFTFESGLSEYEKEGYFEKTPEDNANELDQSYLYSFLIFIKRIFFCWGIIG